MMTNRFGFQLVVMTGGLLITSGTIATIFTSSINQIYITYGLVAGIHLVTFSLLFHFKKLCTQCCYSLNFLYIFIQLFRHGLLSDLPPHGDHPFSVFQPSAVSGHCYRFYWRVPVNVCFGTRWDVFYKDALKTSVSDRG